MALSGRRAFLGTSTQKGRGGTVPSVRYACLSEHGLAFAKGSNGKQHQDTVHLENSPGWLLYTITEQEPVWQSHIIWQICLNARVSRIFF